MRIVGLSHINTFCVRHREADKAFRSWLKEVQAATWKEPLEILDQFPRASILNDSEVVFRIRGNRYRIIAKVSYDLGVVLVTHAFSHPDYQQWIKERKKR